MQEDHPTDDEDRVAERAELLPEEKAAGSDDPQAQAEAILEESDERTLRRDVAPDTQPLEHRTSEEATPPPD